MRWLPCALALLALALGSTLALKDWQVKTKDPWVVKYTHE
jgi:hypothetical protein